MLFKQTEPRLKCTQLENTREIELYVSKFKRHDKSENRLCLKKTKLIKKKNA